MYVLEWRTVPVLTRGLLWCLFLELRSNGGNKHQDNTRVGAETVRHESAYIILFLTRHNESINDNKNDDLFTSSPCLARLVSVLLMTSQSIADDVTMTRQLWRDHSLDINFIHGDIHVRSCKNNWLYTLTQQLTLNRKCCRWLHRKLWKLRHFRFSEVTMFITGVGKVLCYHQDWMSIFTDWKRYVLVYSGKKIIT